MGVNGAVGDGLRRVHKDRQGVVDLEIEEDADALRQGHADEDAGDAALPGPVIAAGSQVLADEGGQG